CDCDCKTYTCRATGRGVKRRNSAHDLRFSRVLIFPDSISKGSECEEFSERV
ncbi:hypothetical protein RYX36_025706, partial [Vicia faba]